MASSAITAVLWRRGSMYDVEEWYVLVVVGVAIGKGPRIHCKWCGDDG